MSTVPKPFAAYTLFKGDITSVDYLHLVQESDGSIPGWIDESGIPQGSLKVGGSSNIFVEGSLVTNPNFLPGTGINFSVAGSNVTINSTAVGGVQSLNSLVGNLNITVGTGLSVAPSGTNILLTNTGVTSLNGGSGDLSLTSTGATISIVASGNTINLEAAGGGSGGVTSLNTLIGDLAITAGAGISISPSTPNVQVINTGLLSLNSITGVADIIPSGAGISILTSGQNVEIQNTGVTSLYSFNWNFHLRTYGCCYVGQYRRDIFDGGDRYSPFRVNWPCYHY